MGAATSASAESDRKYLRLKVLAMHESFRPRQILLAQIVAVLLIALVVAGILWHGVSTSVHARILQNLINRPSGPVAFRFLLQPCVAAALAFRDGVKDARFGRSPYLWTIITDRSQRGAHLREGLIATARIIFLGLCIDGLYQSIGLDEFYPGEAVIMAVGLAFIPYVLLRGPFARIAGWRSAASARRDGEDIHSLEP